MWVDKSEFVQVDWEEGARQINRCEYLFAHSIRESEDLTLELTVTEAKEQAPVLDPPVADITRQLFIGGRPIEPDDTCRVFRLTFDSAHIVSYMVLNELYGLYPEAPQEFAGKLFRIFSRSHLLDFTKRTTSASDDHPGVLQHYEIACQDHVVDVICTGPPRIAVRSPLWEN